MGTPGYWLCAIVSRSSLLCLSQLGSADTLSVGASGSWAFGPTSMANPCSCLAGLISPGGLMASKRMGQTWQKQENGTGEFQKEDFPKKRKEIRKKDKARSVNHLFLSLLSLRSLVPSRSLFLFLISHSLFLLFLFSLR
jgi:hypothetical protein